MAEIKTGESIDLGDGFTNIIFSKPSPPFDDQISIIIREIVKGNILKVYSNEEIFTLIKDGFKFRKLKEAEVIKKEIRGEVEE